MKPTAKAAETEVQEKPAAVLPADDVLFGLRPALADMRACLDGPGAIQVHWLVDKRGRASDFSVEWSTLDNPQVAACIFEQIAERSFELPSGHTQAEAAWTFVRELSAASTVPDKTKPQGKRPRNEGVKFDPPGSLDAHSVDAVVQSGMRLYAHCLRAGVEAQSSLSGRLALSWKVDASGKPSEIADAGSDIDNQELVDCAAECFYALEFPRPRAESVRVTYALLFNED